jgi:uncharacterized membrane protein HdeD (DUF308 family)
MELKYYDKSWLPAIKGGLLIIFGILAMLQITGTIKSLAILFSMLTGMIGILLLSSTLLFGKGEFRIWSIISGIINLLFTLLIIIKVTSPRVEIVYFMIAWVFFNAISEIIEAGILYYQKNAFSAIFLLNALLTLLFGYFLYVLTKDFNPQGVFYVGMIALVFGLANELSAYLLSRIKKG